MVVTALGTALLELETTTGCIVVSLQEAKVSAVENKWNAKKLQKTIAVQYSHEKTFLKKVWSPTEQILPVCADRAVLRSKINEMTALLPWMEQDAGILLFDVLAEVQKTYGDMFDVQKKRTQADIETHLQLESAGLMMSAEDEI